MSKKKRMSFVETIKTVIRAFKHLIYSHAIRGWYWFIVPIDMIPDCCAHCAISVCWKKGAWFGDES